MALKISEMEAKGGVNVPRLDDGTYVAIITAVTHIGYQLQTDWQSGETLKDKFGNDKFSDRVNFTFVVPSEAITVDLEEANEAGEKQVTYQRWLYKEYAASTMAQSGLAKVLKILDPEGKVEDIAELIETPVMITVGSTESGNAKVTAVSTLVKGMPAPVLPEKVDLRSFDMDDSAASVFNELSEYTQNLIRSSRDFDKSPIAKKLLEVETSGDAAADQATNDMLG